MISINTNLASLIIQQNLKNSSLGLNQAIERMTTGSKLNHAKNNAANFSINTNLKTKLGGYLIAQDNASMGLDMLTTAMDSLDLLSNHLSRLRDLAEQAANGTYGGDSLNAIQSEAEARIAECMRVMNNTEYNKINLFEGSDEEPVPMTLGLEGSGGTHDADTTGATKISDCGGILQAGQKYTLNSQAELETLQDYVNGGGDTTGSTFIMTGDITMTGDSFRGIGTDDSHAFKGTFDGNGYEIKNLVIHQSGVDFVGLFGLTLGAKIKNIGVVNCDIEGKNYVGGLVGYSNSTTVTSCYSTGTVTGDERIGGLVGMNASGSTIKDSYATGNVTGQDDVGGLVGYNYYNSSVTNSYATGSVTGEANVGGLVGYNALSTVTNCYATGSITGNSLVGGLVGHNYYDSSVTNSYATGSVTGDDYVGGLVGSNTASTVQNSISNLATNSNAIGANGGRATSTNVAALSLDDMKDSAIMATYGFTEANGWYFDGGTPQLEVFRRVSAPSPSPTPLPTQPTHAGGSNNIVFQVGIHGDSSSVIGLELGFSLDLELNFTTHEDALNSLDKIDEYLKLINNKQTELGAGVNRLESALDSIAVSIQNLTSTKSTINDADIAKESSAYIKSQILQQAASTLLATANQTPSIALGLLQSATIRRG